MMEKNDGDNMSASADLKQKQSIVSFIQWQWNGNERKTVQQNNPTQQQQKCERGVFACNMGLGSFKRDQIIYNGIIIIILECPYNTNDCVSNR